LVYGKTEAELPGELAEERRCALQKLEKLINNLKLPP